MKLDWIRYYAPHETSAEFDCIMQSWDTAAKATELADYPL